MQTKGKKRMLCCRMEEKRRNETKRDGSCSWTCCCSFVRLSPFLSLSVSVSSHRDYPLRFQAHLSTRKLRTGESWWCFSSARPLKRTRNSMGGLLSPALSSADHRINQPTNQRTFQVQPTARNHTGHTLILFHGADIQAGKLKIYPFGHFTCS